MASKYKDRLLQSSGVSSRKFESEYAKKLMLKMGWKEGNGLGRMQSGTTECVQVRRKDDGLGIGMKNKDTECWNNAWWDDTYKNALKKLTIKAKPKKQSSDDDDSEDSSEKTPKVLRTPKVISKKRKGDN